MKITKLATLFTLTSLITTPICFAGQKAKHLIEADKVHRTIYKGKFILGQGQIVGVLDTGLNVLHPDVTGKIAYKRSEILDNFDNDGNGLTDDINGWNFKSGNGILDDDNGHGTHVATTIVATNYGIAPAASVVPIKVTENPEGSVSDINLIKAIKYAADNGVRIINLSLRGYYAHMPVTKYVIEEAIKYAEERDVLLVVAAGNDNQTNITNTAILPAGSKSNNVLVVCASTDSGSLASFSNFSPTDVDICAPGVNIEAANGFYGEFLGANGTRIGNGQPRTVTMNGTSMATPVVSGVAALLWSMEPSLTPTQVKDIILSSSLNKSQYYFLRNTSQTDSIVNALDAVNYLRMHYSTSP